MLCARAILVLQHSTSKMHGVPKPDKTAEKHLWPAITSETMSCSSAQSSADSFHLHAKARFDSERSVSANIQTLMQCRAGDLADVEYSTDKQS